MKRLYLLIVLLIGSIPAWSQFSSGVMLTSPGTELKAAPAPEQVVSSKWLFGIGWQRTKWKTARRFRTWDLNLGYGNGVLSSKYYQDQHHLPPAPNGSFKQYSVGMTWKVGFPLFHREYDDPFLWYFTAGAGISMTRYNGVYTSGNRDFYFVDQPMVPKFLDLGIGFEKRMGKDWYYNMSANVEVTYGVAANVKVRFMKRKTWI